VVTWCSNTPTQGKYIDNNLKSNKLKIIQTRSVKYTIGLCYQCLPFVLVSYLTKFQVKTVCTCRDISNGPNSEPCGTPLRGLKFYISRTSYRRKILLYSFFRKNDSFYSVFHTLHSSKIKVNAIISKLVHRTVFKMGSN
jgi:hypothetical protein